ncbi:hypothetical protein M0805_008344 [Coniferiporia weirii]|nr:hypothetical protein M0805_008344 [Coniferiporia weirii]
MLSASQFGGRGRFSSLSLHRLVPPGCRTFAATQRTQDKRKNKKARTSPQQTSSQVPAPASPGSTGQAPLTAVTKNSLQGCKRELELLRSKSSRNGTGGSESHDLLTAPLMTRSALLASGKNKAQYGVLGEIATIHLKRTCSKPEAHDSRLYMNCNAPFSALVCGVQGSGKSHTVSTMLENMFTAKDERIGTLSKPLCGLVLHLGDGGPQSIPNEAAWLGVNATKTSKSAAVKVKVFVSPSSLKTMKEVYKPLGPNISVEPLYFTEEELDAQAFLSMMAVGTSDSAPLYMRIFLSILRELGEGYSYREFTHNLQQKRKEFNAQQDMALQQRMTLLENFMDKNAKQTKKAPNRFSEGQITIVDLSDPFIDPASACGIFEILIRLFSRAKVDTGKVIVVDEAHKYLSTNNGSSGLVNYLLSLVRENRHKGMRVVISTQEPTVVPSTVMDLCSIILLHRFSSLAWWEHVMRHVSADFSESDAFDRIVKLNTGEAIILCPSGLKTRKGKADQYIVEPFGRSFLHGRIRQRVTEDGGKSVLVV